MSANIPRLGTDERFAVNIDEDGAIRVRNMYRNTVIRIEDIDAATAEGKAHQLERLLHDVLKAGHEQGIKSVRIALGFER